MALVSFYFTILLSLLSFYVSAEVNKNHHPSCPPFYCGKLGWITFPFTNTSHPDCGLTLIDGCSEPVQKIQLKNGGKWYEVESITQNNTDNNIVQIFDRELQSSLKSNLCDTFTNFNLSSSPHVSFQITPILTLFKCCDTFNNTPSSLHKYNYKGCKGYNIFYSHLDENSPSPPSSCSVLQLPAIRGEKCDNLSELLTANYTLEIQISGDCYDCFNRGGQCEFDNNSEQRFHCSRAEAGKKGLSVFKAVTVTAVIVFGISMVLLCAVRKILSCNRSIFIWKKGASEHENTEAIIRNYSLPAPKRYSYSDIKKITKSFRDKLGQGGYGSVFRGNLPDGCPVAVKVLNESKGNGEEFMNEVAIISRTSHVNIVTLLGFCFEGAKRALVYEFMSKGSLEKFIYEESSLKINCQLSWQKLYQIAVGIARGLDYLHRGCNMKILHFDIKPHNILLDDEFCPKISDFGLAKVCSRKDSIVSMMSMRGTAGYIAPEVFCRSFGGVSHKSDVYSYGMLILEVVGGRRKLDDKAELNDDTYFPQLIHNQLEQGEELGLQSITNEDDSECSRKMIIVGLWCIQTNPSNRPPISRVVEMLEGSVKALQIPPKPFLSSPPRSEASSITTLESSYFSEY